MWADSLIASLCQGKVVEFHPSGHSMEPLIKHRALVTVAPLGAQEPKTGDVVLCKVKGQQFLHLIKAVENGGSPSARFLIGNNRGKINGWTSRAHVYGIVTRVAAGKEHS